MSSPMGHKDAKATRPWYEKKRVIIPGGLLALAAFGSAGGSGSEPTAAPAATVAATQQPAPAVTVTETQQPAPAVTVTETQKTETQETQASATSTSSSAARVAVPDVVGMNHQLAQDTLQAAGFYALREEDATGADRLLINDRGWEVVKQDPKAGSKLDSSPTITLSSKKLGEGRSTAARAEPTRPTAARAEPTRPTAPRAEPTRTEAASAESTAQANAREKASEYLQVSAFSRMGLIKQLEFEGFSKANATYGVDKQNVNWNKQAEKKAQQYLDLSSFSRSGLIKQLEFEGFTSAQARHGVSAVGL